MATSQLSPCGDFKLEKFTVIWDVYLQGFVISIHGQMSDWYVSSCLIIPLNKTYIVPDEKPVPADNEVS